MSRLTKAKIERVLQAWVSLGLAVGGVEVSPDGTVRVLPPLAEAKKPVHPKGPRSWDE